VSVSGHHLILVQQLWRGSVTNDIEYYTKKLDLSIHRERKSALYIIDLL